MGHGSEGQSGAAVAISGRTFPNSAPGSIKRCRSPREPGSTLVSGERVLRGGAGHCSIILKAGIDPTGGQDWSSGNIKWTAVEISDNKYVRLVTEDVTVGDSGKVTVFTWGEPRDLPSNSAAFFDDAVLEVTSSGSASDHTGAAPPAPAPGQPTAAASGSRVRSTGLGL